METTDIDRKRHLTLVCGGRGERTFKKAFRESGIKNRVTPHTLRHSFANHLQEGGEDIRSIKDVSRYHIRFSAMTELADTVVAYGDEYLAEFGAQMSRSHVRALVDNPGLPHVFHGGPLGGVRRVPAPSLPPTTPARTAVAPSATVRIPLA